ncbi:MAG: C39 family peptidase, partial [Spirochaetales bacterium]
MGRWSRSSASFSDRDDSGKVETDTLLLAAKSRRFKLRAELSAGAGGLGAVVVRRLGIISRDRARIREPSRPNLLRECLIQAPARSQMLESAEIRGRICSPTSAAMALQSLGIDLPTAFVAADCYDAGAKIYGNWPFNVASLWRLGALARLDFFPNMELALGDLLKGHSLIASVKFAEGCLRGAPISKTSGHLVLIVGLGKDESGEFRVLVNDPAAARPEEAPRAYDLAEFERAWTGIAYVIEGKRSARIRERECADSAV